MQKQIQHSKKKRSNSTGFSLNQQQKESKNRQIISLNKDTRSIEERLINFNNKLKADFFALRFEDNEIEAEFQAKNFRNNRINYLLIHLFFLINLVLKITVTFYNFYSSILIANIVVMLFICLAAATYQFCPRLRVKEITNKTLAYCIILVETIQGLITIIQELDSIANNLFHYNSFYFLLFISFAIFLFPIEENFLCCVIFVFSNFLVYYTCFFSYVDYRRFHVYELCVFGVLVFLTILVKRQNCFYFRESYLDAFKFKKFYIYFQEIINNMNAFFVSADEAEIRFVNKSFNNFLLKHKKHKKILKPITDKNELVAYLSKYPGLVLKKFELGDYVDLKAFEKTENQSQESFLFLKFLKKEMKFLLKNNKQVEEEIKDNRPNVINNINNNNIQKKFIIDKEFSAERLNPNEVKLEKKAENELKGKESEINQTRAAYRIINNANKNFNFISNGKQKEFDLKIIEDSKGISSVQNYKNKNAKTANLNKAEKHKPNIKPKVYLLSHDTLLKKFEEFKLNLSHMQKVYLENLYPIDINIYNKREKEKLILKKNINNNNNNSKLIDTELLNENNTPAGNMRLMTKNFNLSDNNMPLNELINKLEEEKENESSKKIIINMIINLKKKNLLQISEIIENHFHGKNKFYYLGEFKNFQDKNFYQIYFRKNNGSKSHNECSCESANSSTSQSDSEPEIKMNPIPNSNLNLNSNLKNDLPQRKQKVDFLIYDITRIREAEKLESKLKSKFLGKIAHEFKTPINSILGLIKRILFNLENEENNISELPKDIKQVENLCSYTLFLIDDIIEYSFKSNYSNSILFSDAEEFYGKHREDDSSSIKAKSEAGFLRFGKSGDSLISQRKKLFNSFENLRSLRDFNIKKLNGKGNELKGKSKFKENNNSIDDVTVKEHSIRKNRKFEAEKTQQRKQHIKGSEYDSESSYTINEITENNICVNANYDYLFSKSENLAKQKTSLNNLSKNKNGQKKYLNETLSSDSEQLEKSVQNINKKNNKNNLVINKDLVDLAEITEFCKGVAETLLISKGKESHIKILCNFDNEILSYRIISDEFRIKQILLNFLSNSVKFTKSGFILIKSFLIENNSKIKISIVDSGMGIKEAELKYLFTDKFMSESTKMLNQAGSGLGLSISKSISDRLGFLIEVKSEFGKGSEFSLIIGCKPKKKKSKNSEFKEIKSENFKQMNLFDSSNNDENLNLDSNTGVRCAENTLNRLKLKSKFKKEESEFNEENISRESFSRPSRESNRKDQQIIHNKSKYEEDYFDVVHVNQEKRENNSHCSNIIHFVEKQTNNKMNSNTIKNSDINNLNITINKCSDKILTSFSQEKSNRTRLKSVSRGNEPEENNLQIVSDHKSSSGIIPSEKNTNSNINFPNNEFDKIIEERSEANLNLNSLESSIVKISKDLGDREKSNSSLFTKGPGKKKLDKSLEIQNESSQSNKFTVKLNNTDNNNAYCFKLDDYYKIVAEMKKNNKQHFSFITDSEISNLHLKSSLGVPSECKSSLIIIHNPDDQHENLNYNFDKLIHKNYASDSHLDFNSYLSNSYRSFKDDLPSLNYRNAKNQSNSPYKNESEKSVISPFDIKHPKLIFPEPINNLNFSLNSNDFSNILQENSNYDNKINGFNIDFTSEDENKYEKQKSLFSNSNNNSNNINNNHNTPAGVNVQKIKSKIEGRRCFNIDNPIVENNDLNYFNNFIGNEKNENYEINNKNKSVDNLDKEDLNVANIPCEESINFKFLEETFGESNNKNSNFINKTIVNNNNNNKFTINRNISFNIINNVNITGNDVNICPNINNNKNNFVNKNSNESNNNFRDNKKDNKNFNNKININLIDNENNKIIIANTNRNKNTEIINQNLLHTQNKQKNSLNDKNNPETNQNLNLNLNPTNNSNDNNLKKKQVKKSFFSKDIEKDKVNEIALEPIAKEKFKILIVDDHTFIRSSLRINLERILREQKIKNLEIIEGRDGVDIINSVIKDQEQNNLIKCVFSDENMEYLNGSEAFEILKNLELKNKIKKIPLCSVTAYEDKEKLYAKNSRNKVIFDKFLIKPCSQNDLLQFLQEFKIL